MPWKLVPPLLAGFLLVSACSTTVNVIGRVEPGSELYYGTATAEGTDGGKIEMATADGKRCIGEYSLHRPIRSSLIPTTPSGGLAHLFCNDGRTAGLRFTSLSISSGYGYGRASDGSAVRFSFGLSEAEAAPHLGSMTAGGAKAKRSHGKGTGFFVGSAGEILTNEHVAGNCASITVRLADGTEHPARTLANDATNDLSLLKLDINSPAVLTFDAAPAPRLGDTVITFGFPLPGMLPDSGNLTTGSITSFSGMKNDSRLVQISTPVQPGNSGGPLVDDRGVLIGVIRTKLNALYVASTTGDIPQNANFAVKEVFARTFMLANGIPPTLAKPTTPKRTVAEIGESLRVAVGQVVCHGD